MPQGLALKLRLALAALVLASATAIPPAVADDRASQPRCAELTGRGRPMAHELQGSAEAPGELGRIVPGDSRPAHHCSQLRGSADDGPRQRRSRAAGPVEGREEWLLSQDRLTLPAFSPYALGRGRTELRVHFDWGSDFGWDQDLAGEVPHDRRYLVDGEHRTLEVDLRRGVGDRLAVGLRVPLRWRGGGILDPVIDAFHRVVTSPLGLPDNGRPEFLRNRLRAVGRDAQGRPVEWTARGGTGVGSLELSAARTLHTRPEGWTGALALRLVLPTATGPFASSGLAAGVQYAAARPLGRRADVYLGAGAAAFTDRESHGIRYEPARVHFFSAFEWRPARRWSLLVQADGSSRLVANLARYPGVQSYLRIGAKVDLSERLRLEAGFVENMVNQDVTTDFGIFLGLTTRL